jgi:hypothetical protein
MKIALGIFLLLHGVAHLVGFVVPWRLMRNAEMPYKTTLLAGHWDVGDVGIRVNGVLWLVTALAFALAGMGVMRQAQWWETVTLSVSLASLAMCVVSWPEARIGVFVNVAILLFLLLNRKLNWLVNV